jgi:hypothetical protein
MKLLIYVTAITLGFTQILVGQKVVNPSVTKAKVVAEAYYYGSGMSGIVGEHLIVRVYSDRTVEFDDLGVDTNYILKRSRISRKGFSKLNKLLSDENMGKIPDTYGAVYATIDHTENLKLNLLVNGKYKEINVENFKPDLPKTKKIYPAQLVEIVRFLESLRSSAEIHFFFRKN